MISLVETAPIDKENLEQIGEDVRECLGKTTASNFRKAWKEWELSREMASGVFS